MARLLLSITLLIATPSFAAGGMSIGRGLPAVFLIMGQSNIYGGSEGASITVPDAPGASNSIAIVQNVRGAVTDARIIHWATGSSPWPAFTKKWQEEVGGNVILLFTAQGGTCLASDPDDADCGGGAGPLWAKEVTGCVACPHNGVLYALTQTYFSGQGIGDGVRAVLWNQGECEMVGACDTWPNAQADKQGDYQAALEQFATDIGNDFKVPVVASPPSDCSGHPGGTPCLDIVDASCGAPGATRILIHDGAQAAITAHSNLRQGPDFDDLRFRDGDCAHIHEVQTLGERWFDAVEAAGLAY